MSLNIIGTALAPSKLRSLTAVDAPDLSGARARLKDAPHARQDEAVVDDYVSRPRTEDASADRSSGVKRRSVVTEDMDEKTARKVRELSEQKKRAVLDEDYDTAKNCKLAIDRLTKASTELRKLEREKNEAVEREDYDLAKELKVCLPNMFLDFWLLHFCRFYVHKKMTVANRKASRAVVEPRCTVLFGEAWHGASSCLCSSYEQQRCGRWG